MSDAPAPTSPPHPLSLPGARPSCTGGRAIGVLLVHGFTGSPASMKPWGALPRRAGVRRRGAAAARARHPWQDLNQVAWTDWYAEAERGVRPAARRRATPSWSAALSMGGVAGAPARRGARRPGRRASCWSTRSSPAPARSCTALPVLKHVVPSLRGVVNDIKKPGQDEHGYTRAAAQGPAPQVTAMWKVVVPDLPQGHPAAALLPLRRRPRHRRVLVADHAATRSPRPTSRSGSSRTATTSPRSTTTPSGSSRSPPSSSPG